MNLSGTNSTHDNNAHSYALSAVAKTLIIYAVVRLLAQIYAAASMTFTDAITLGLIDKYGGKNNQRLGINRFWNTVGGSLGAPFSGLLMDFFSKGGGGKRNYLPGFITNGCAALIVTVVVTCMEVTTAAKPKKVFRSVSGLMRRPPFAVFLVAVVVVGKRLA